MATTAILHQTATIGQFNTGSDSTVTTFDTTTSGSKKDGDNNDDDNIDDAIRTNLQIIEPKDDDDVERRPVVDVSTTKIMTLDDFEKEKNDNRNNIHNSGKSEIGGSNHHHRSFVRRSSRAIVKSIQNLSLHHHKAGEKGKNQRRRKTSSILVDSERKKQEPRRTKNLSFDPNFEVTEYESVLGDNPGGNLMGAPISLGWTKKSCTKYNLDEYETIKKDCPRRNDTTYNPHTDMVLKDAERKKRLVKIAKACTVQEYVDRAAEVYDVRQKREKSAKDHKSFFHKITNASKPMAKRLMRKEQNRHKYRAPKAAKSSGQSTRKAAVGASTRSFRR